MIKLSASLLDSYIYLQNLNPNASWYEKTKQQFADRIKCLGEFEENEAMRRGKFFEEDIEDICNDNYLPRKIKLSDIVDIDKKCVEDKELEYDIRKYHATHQIVDICKGGKWQEWTKPFQLRINDIEFVFFSRTDNINICKDTEEKYIYDLKRMEKDKNKKYQNNSQHLIYMLATGIPRFKYIKAYGEMLEIEGKAEERYIMTENTEGKLKSIVDSFIQYLKYEGLYDIFLCNFEYKKKVWW